MSVPGLTVTPAVSARLAALRHASQVTAAEATRLGLTLIETAHGAEGAPDQIRLQLLTDAAGVVRGAHYQTAAAGPLLAAYDAMAELCQGRTLAEVVQVTPRLVEAHLRGDGSEPAFPFAGDPDQPFYVLRKAAERAAAPKPAGASLAAELPWVQCGLFEKVRRIEGVLDAHVRPALASDGGGIELVDLRDPVLQVQYQGACGSCSSSIGGTLQFITDSLNNHLGTALQVQVTSMEEMSIAP